MKKTLLFFAAFFALQFAAQAQLGDLAKKAQSAKDKVIGSDLSQTEIGNGLKEALNEGVGAASDFLSAKDGYFKSAYKIFLPDEARKVTAKLQGVPGFQNAEAEITERMNRAAEDAAVKAKPIFLAAIKKMSFQDAMNILMGNPDAATRYLEKNTYQALYDEFKPIIQASLDKVKAREYWRSAVTAYNKLPLVTPTNPELDDHVTKMALIGLFHLVEKKEKDIRSNPKIRSTELLQKVFAKQDKKN